MAFDLKNYMALMVEKKASDLYLTFNAPPCLRINGHLLPIDKTLLTGENTRDIANSIMNERQRKEFETNPEVNIALIDEKLGRFRVNIYRQRNEVALVMRLIPIDIPDPKSLNLPKILTDVIMEKRGLILFVGATGTGKSTSLASLISYRNQVSDHHIVTIEDPIEFAHSHRKSLVSQREVGTDTNSYGEALKSAMRQAPDLILIGEIRTQETMEYALHFAESGHLCLSTLHANNANQALDRILNFFPEAYRKQVLMDLSLNLKAIVSQRLIPSPDKTQRFASFEILLGTPIVSEMIKRGEIDTLRDVMEKSTNVGMMTFDRSLYELFRTGKIDEETALSFADSKNNLRLRMTLEKGESPKTGSLSIKPEDEDEQNKGSIMR